MRIQDHIARKVIEEIMEQGYKIKKKDYLSLEANIADRINKELSSWLSYDVDLWSK